MKTDKWVIIDTETTGIVKPIYAVEIAAQQMLGWEPVGQPFRILLNHDVPIERQAEALHGYSRDYLRKHGEDPRSAHMQFHEYCRHLPFVAYNISYDWDRVLIPEYMRLNIPQTGFKGFCALALARRAITDTDNLKLDTIKDHFGLSTGPSHSALHDVQALVRLFQTVLRERLEPAGIIDFDSLRTFSKTTPVSKCLEKLHSACLEQEVWYVLTEEDQQVGPFSMLYIRELAAGGDCYIWRKGMPDWQIASNLPEFADAFKSAKKKSKGPKAKRSKSVAHYPGQREDIVEIKVSLNQLIGLCKGILADGIITEEELLLLYDWIESCQCTHIYPMSVVADTLERICEDGVVTGEEQIELMGVMNEAISASE